MLKRSHLAVLLGLVAVAVGLGAYDCNTEVRWLGSFPLQVELKSGGHRVSKVSFDTLPWRASAEEVRRYQSELDRRPVEAFDGKRFTVPVRKIGRSSGLGRDLSYAQCQLLVLWLEFADGGSRFEVIDIPDGRSQRHLVVELP